MKLKLISLAVMLATPMAASADKEYWLGSDGNYTRDRNGHCVRTIKWTPEAAIPGCEGGEAAADKAQAKPAAAKADDSANKASSSDASNKAAAVTAGAGVAAAVVAGDKEPEYIEISLASGATFKLGGSTLSDEGKATIVELMNEFKAEDVKAVVIEGHTDSSGDAAFNQQLSEKRAEAVKAELVANGANPDKISTVGYGESRPVADNGTREGRAKNRRVEIKVDGKRRQI